MDKVCPACNELSLEGYKCRICKEEMIDLGRAQEVLQDDYTANMPINDAKSYCIHVYRCKNCGDYENIPVNKIFV
jgi:hypothetical protein